MKILVSALVALSVLAGIGAPAQATTGSSHAKKLFDKLDREGRGGQGGG
jgi:hypothetical protein